METNASSSKLERGVSAVPKPKLERGVSVPPGTKLERGVTIPSNERLDRRNRIPTKTMPIDKRHHWTQISPALYATPESTPLPDSPSSFPPSPYIINHKRRGPRLIKSFSEDDVATCKQASDEPKEDENGNASEKEVESVVKDDSVNPSELADTTEDDSVTYTAPAGGAKENYFNGISANKSGTVDTINGLTEENGLMKPFAFNLEQDGEFDVFADPQESMSVKGTGESEGIGGAERSLNSMIPIAEFYDAWEELLSDSGSQGPQLPVPDFESELRETKLTLLLEIEKRKQAEETLSWMRDRWHWLREQLALVGLTLPADPTTLADSEQSVDPAADLSQQLYLARFVSNSIGRGIGKAEVEMEMEAQIKMKNFEIARLLDRLHYYEAVNQEMSQRNQEVVETARRLRQRRKRRQRWLWGSVASAITLGSAVLAYSYLQSGKGWSSRSTMHASNLDRETK